MRSILTKVTLFLTLLEIVLASVLEPLNNKSPVLPEAFDCGDAVFTGNFLQKVLNEIKSKNQFRIFHKEKFLRGYQGPPFTRPYLAWPISLRTNSYQKALSGPYRAILKENFEIFSILAKRTNGIQECKMIEEVSQFHQKFDCRCGADQFTYDMLLSAVDNACSKIKQIATQEYPARYDGPHFIESGKQRYIYPIKVGKDFRDGSNPGPYRVVLNSECKLAGAVTVYNHGEIFPCYGTPTSG